MDPEKEIETKRAELDKINKKIEALERLKKSGKEDANFFSNLVEGIQAFDIPLMPAYLVGAMTVEAWEEFEPDKDAPVAGKIASRTLGALCCLPMAATTLLFASPVLMLVGPINLVIASVESTKNAVHNKRLEKVDEKLTELKQQKAELEKELSIYESNINDDEITA